MQKEGQQQQEQQRQEASVDATVDQELMVLSLLLPFLPTHDSFMG